jgi:CubicO group peptidase (beta-lactamase class C family)
VPASDTFQVRKLHEAGALVLAKANMAEFAWLGFENSSVYQDAMDAFEAAWRSIVATIPGSVFHYINAGPNVLGALIRDQIVRRDLPYHQTVYGLLADRLGMANYQHSADIAGNLIASGAGFATLRDYAKLGVLYLQDGVWNRERLLPPRWADYALTPTPTHTGTSYAARFRANTDRLFPDLPTVGPAHRYPAPRRHRLTVGVANETDHPMDLAGPEPPHRHRNRHIDIGRATECPPLSAMPLAKSSMKAGFRSGSGCA